MDVTKIIVIVIELITAVIGAMVIPYIKNRYSNAQIEIGMKWVRIAVAAAEQLFDSNMGDLKKKYVKDYLEKKGIRFSKADLNNAIESAVLELHNELYGTEKAAEKPQDSSEVKGGEDIQ